MRETQNSLDPVRVLAIIVAFNQPDALRRCLTSLNSQERVPDGVLVVDNSEPLPIEVEGAPREILKRTRVVRTGRNSGPAGGFAFGLGMFQEEGEWTHAWLMDDDSYPDPSALEVLLDNARELSPGCLILPKAINENTGLETVHPGWVGILVDRLAVRLGGLPRAELFWWAEDTEYLQFRLPRRGVKVGHATDARVLYDLVRRTGGRAPWKYYYETRNTIYYRLYIQRSGLKGIGKLCRSLVRLFGSAAAGPQRWQKLRMYFRGAGDGLSGRLGHQVRPPVPLPR